jgi:hypothetical protein
MKEHSAQLERADWLIESLLAKEVWIKQFEALTIAFAPW